MIERVSRDESIATLTVGSQIPDVPFFNEHRGIWESTAISRPVCFRRVWQWLGAYHMYKN